MARKDDGSDDNDASSSSPMNNDNNDTLVTKEMFLRELLADPVVKRKKGAGNKRSSSEYKVLDNRDSLPFRVENQVPDPYTSKEAKRKNANKVRKPPSSVEEGLKSSLYTNDFENQDTRTMLGEYILDKHTTTGDILEIGDVQYKVIRHKCQYKYAGGKRFVMVRKILQVKEIGRLQTEEYLKRQWKQSSSQQDGGDSSNISLSWRIISSSFQLSVVELAGRVGYLRKLHTRQRNLLCIP